MDQVWVAFQSGWQSYVAAALEPLHRLTWQTFSLFLVAGLLVALISTWIIRASWRYSTPTFPAKKIKGHHHMFRENLRVSAANYLRFHGRSPDMGIRHEIARRDIADDANKYYVVTVVEREKKKVVLYKELRIQPGQAKGALQDEFIQLDQDVLTDVRLNNGYDDDDDPGTNVTGDYDIYIRSVRWYDVRHWLLHPNREVRIAVWVTLITTTMPVVVDVLFG